MRRAAHQDQLGDTGRDVRCGDEGQRDIGQRAEGAERDALGLGAAQSLDQVEDAVLGAQRRRRGRQDEITEAARAMGTLDVDQPPAERPRAAGIDRQLGAAGQLDDAERVARRRRQRQIAGNRNQPQHIELWRGERQEDRDRVVDPGIGVDDDRARHGATLPSANTNER